MIQETKDASVVARLNRFVHDLHVELYPHLFKPYRFERMLNFFESKIGKPYHTFLIAIDEEPVGFVWVEERYEEENDFKKARASLYVHQISVDTTKQQRGYGRKLLEAVEDLAREKGIDAIELDYWAGNTGARSFYEKQGYVQHREVVQKKLK
ncbi:GNAT family N-acetyltransferase [Halobacillus litoralis]|uniref:GNAT family N-acetyltransferase n=1 Tax=Halobacillus litoralis TaxID=45668 RepID=UPI001CD3E768|nr:GNAT family N-acetyltransferase [Halobacillus litoralis]MCA0972335.1 GNAT family N-acetyltransferase [Halobacillus litoralis]